MDKTQQCDLKLRLSKHKPVGMWINKKIFELNGNLKGHQTFAAMSPGTPLVSFQWPDDQQSAQVTSRWIPNITFQKPNRLGEFARDTAENIGMDCWEVLKLVVENCLEKFDACLLEVTMWGMKLGHRDPKSALEFKGDRRSEITSVLMELLADTEYLFLDAVIDWTVEVEGISDETHLMLPALENSQTSGYSRSLSSGQVSSLALDGPTSLTATSGSLQSQQEYDWTHVDPKVIYIRILQEIKWMNNAVKELSEKMDKNSQQIIHGLAETMGYTGSQQHPVLKNEEVSSSQANLALQDSGFNIDQSVQHSMDQERRQVTVDPAQGTAGFRAQASPSPASNRSTSGRAAHPSTKAETSHPASKPHRQGNPSAKNNARENPVRNYARQSGFRHHSSLGSIRETEPEDSHKDRQKTPPTAKTTGPQRTSTQERMTKPSPHHRPVNQDSQESVSFNDKQSNSTKSVSQSKVQLEMNADHTEAMLVKESVDRAYLDDEVKAPKAKSFDTIICLDISESMKDGGAFEEMKKLVLEFIDGVEENINNSGVEENMGLVVFGGRARVLQNLTNDLNLIRDRIEDLKAGGNSPFVEALLVSMAAFVKKGGIVSVSGEWEVKPRIIFFSDGYPSESTPHGETDIDRPANISSVRLSLLKMLNSFKHNDQYNKVHPVMFIPVGQKADVMYMENMAKICDGRFVPPEKIQDLCYYFRMQETIGKVLVCLRREKGKDKLDATIQALTPDLSEEHRLEVSEKVKKELDNPSRNQSRRTKPNEMDYVFEDTARVKEHERLPLGTRVVRGPDWKYNDQDGGGPGTVINHHERRSIHWVNWDKTDYNCYPFSRHQGYHIMKAEDQPRIRKGNEPLDIGMTVKKGPDWNAAEAKPEQGIGIGVIIRRSREKRKLMVRWPNGEIQVCSWAPDGPAEVEYCEPYGEKPDQKPKPDVPKTTANPSSEDEPVLYVGHGKWQWRDSNNVWQDYSPAINRQIEEACKKKNSRSCVFERDGKQRRVMFRFKKKVEKSVEAGTEYEIRRLVIG